MLLRKITFVFIVLAVIFLCMSNVSADDSNSTDVSNLDDLAIQINQSHEGQVISLECDYISTNSTNDYIVIDKSLTIDGNDHTIDARDVKRVFWVKADNVCIRNINFINSRTTSLAGGVISWWGNNGSLEDCNFENNSATSAGGAVLWRGDAGSISNCNFTRNDVRIGAAASLTDGDGFDPSQLHIQIVNSEGGALYISGNNISVNSCNFENNIALLNGGAISINWGSNITVSNSRFKNNTAPYNGGAIDWNGYNATVANSIFKGNSPNNLFLNTNAVIVNSTFDKRDSIDSWYGVIYINVVVSDIGTFDELAYEVSMTPEGGILVLDSDYEYVNGTNKGVVISKSITIDGAGHTLNGNHLSRMFNVTANNVTIRNVNFVNGNAFGRYSGIAGGGAIYWNGTDGLLENCRFINNTGSGIEDDPYENPEEIFVDENGTVWHTYRVRPDGAKLNEGGAVVWSGTNGTVSKCIFINNNVGYPDSGGAIMWRGANGNVISCKFDKNGAWCGSAICWMGNNGTVSHSIIANSTFLGGGIYWFGKDGCVKNSIFVGNEYDRNIMGYNVAADYNFWGDTLENPNMAEKVGGVSKWLLMKFSNNGKFVEKGQKVIIKYDITTLTDRDGKLSNYYELINYSSQFVYKAAETGFLNITCVNGNVVVNVDSKQAIISSDLTAYYAKKISYSVKVFDLNGKAVGKKVKFTINKKNHYVITDKNGVATLKISLKPGTYTVDVAYGKIKVKNKITVKTTLITKNVSKKVKKSGKFTVKVLSSKGKALAKKNVKVKFKGKTYVLKTNSKGLAAFKIPSNLKVGKYTIKTSYNGLTNSNRITVKK
ncbi:right-handed parallel beta-helix repeat-containing protein [uncultured Methanobrevibacter sp.]|uniref:right-handed parallel beta-helix repeat-containing protein n=1 Tax=uncultured Methanobrevibacter sp. TaxID=253161 RepID=UPI00262BC89E|nr:right-handed parallel beta-helix repeat-containing protein [uncultured Methanobrevibacter sp.]